MDSLNELIWTEEDEIMPLSLLDERPMVQVCEISLATCTTVDDTFTPFGSSMYGQAELCGC